MINGNSFNQARRGNVSGNERSLAANAQDSFEVLSTLIADIRNYYNYRRRHQALHGAMTPEQAWEAAERPPSDRTPINHKDLRARADPYRDTTLALRAAEGPEDVLQDLRVAAGQEEKPAVPDGRLRDSTVDRIVVSRTNPVLYLQGRRIKVPSDLLGAYRLVSADTEYSLLDPTTGTESIYFPLTATTGTNNVFPRWHFRAVRLRDPKPAWTDKHQTHRKEHFPEAS